MDRPKASADSVTVKPEQHSPPINSTSANANGTLVDMSGTVGEVIDSVGLNDLGGEDFDEVLATMARPRLTTAVPSPDALREACRIAKEGVRPQSRNVLIDLPGETVRIPVAPKSLPRLESFSVPSSRELRCWFDSGATS